MLASSSENKALNSWYSSGMSMGAPFVGGASMASTSAELIIKVLAFSFRRRSFFTVFRKAVSDMAAMLIAPSFCGLGGMSKVSALVV